MEPMSVDATGGQLLFLAEDGLATEMSNHWISRHRSLAQDSMFVTEPTLGVDLLRRPRCP
ncbi:hypothetical protein BKP42_44580 [Rhodococcus erythropolis]|nr:hypothetical protein BKP42_44580 [Rhodococcus erythropolis]